jgi:hypothetical protein
MLFSVIYEFDCPMDYRVGRFMPSQRKLFDTTECEDGEPSDWCAEVFGGKVKHRKLCAVLTRKQFDRFIRDTNLHAEEVQTMGSLGAPGCGYGCSPAVSFSTDEWDEAIQSAYVTPLPLAYKIGDMERGPKRTFTEDDFQRVRKAMLAVWGY